VAGEAFKVKAPKTANNKVFADESKLILFALPPDVACAATSVEKK
jgi:hypothetical protein